MTHPRGTSDRRLRKLAVTAVTVAALAAAVTGCGSSSKSSSSSAAGATTSASSAATTTSGGATTSASGGGGGQGVIYSGSGSATFLIYNGAVSRWLGIDAPNIKRDLKKYAPNASFQVEDAKGSASTQLAQAQSTVLKGTNAIVITPAQADPQSVVNVVQRAHIPMVVLEGLFTGLPSGAVTGLVSPAPDAIGAAEAKYVLSRVPKGSDVALINGDLSGQFAVVEHNGIESYLHSAAGKAKDIKIVADKSTPDWAESDAESETAGVLTATHDQVKGVIAGNDDVAAGAIQALQKAGLQKKVVVAGMGAELTGAQNILKGDEGSTTSWNIATEDDQVAQILAYSMAHKTVPKTLFNSTYNDGSGTFPFAVTPVHTLQKGQITDAMQYGGLTKGEVCKGLPASVGAPCS